MLEKNSANYNQCDIHDYVKCFSEVNSFKYTIRLVYRYCIDIVSFHNVYSKYISGSSVFLSNALFLWYFVFTLSATLVVPIWSISPSSNIKDPSFGTDSVRNFRLFPNATESCLNTSKYVQWWTRSEISLHWVRIESFPLLMTDWLASWNCTLVFEGQSTLSTYPALSSICTEKSLELLKWSMSKLINGLFLEFIGSEFPSQAAFVLKTAKKNVCKEGGCFSSQGNYMMVGLHG